jgi:glycosyltransferase involved in cell wall biosynthesis
VEQPRPGLQGVFQATSSQPTNLSFSQTMRIALVITELHPGGAERCLVHLAIYLKSQGHQVQVWELWPPPPAGKTLLTEELDAAEIVWKSGGAVKPWDFPRAARWLRRELIAFRPDVVQAFLFHANVAAALATRTIDCKLFGGARVRQPQWWRQRLQKWASSRMHKLVCVSQGVYDHCQQVERIPPAKLIVIPNGIELADNEFAQHAPTAQAASARWETLGLPPAARVLLFVGRLDRQKGVEELLRESDRLLRKLPEHQLVLMGEGPCRTELERIRGTQEHAPRIHLVGWQPNAIDWMRCSEMLLLPTRYEGMPNVVLEAMAAGKPVVAFRVEGVAELLGEEVAGQKQCIAPGDFDAFFAAIEELAVDPALRASLGQANRQRIASHFQLAGQLAQYATLYEA